MCGIWFYYNLELAKNKLQKKEFKKNDEKNERNEKNEKNKKDIKKENKNEKYELRESFNKIKGRGPDNSYFSEIHNGTYLGFHRLAITDTDEKSNQPFTCDKYYFMCNGEIYNYKELIIEHDLKVNTTSDCEAVFLLYLKYGIDKTVELTKGEYAFIIVEIGDKLKVTCARDQFGVRPLFYYIDYQTVIFSSEIKGMIDLIDKNGVIKVFTPGTTSNVFVENDEIIFNSKHFYNPISFLKSDHKKLSIENIHKNIRELFVSSVKKRLHSSRKIGCLLSGGLDSSIVSSVVSKFLPYKLETFTIGLENGTDLKYAKQVSEHIGSKHTEIIVTPKDALDAIDRTIYATESYDITTVRASVWQLLLAEYISKTDIKVLLVGEGSDELLQGYIYFKNRPNCAESFKDSLRLLKNIHLFDGLRADRCMSNNGLEIRVPFLDIDFTNYVLSLDPNLLNDTNLEKKLFRDSFKDSGFLPENVLYRKKEAFSDGVSTLEKSWFQTIKEYIDEKVDDAEYHENKDKYRTHTKESYYYRKKFEEYFRGQSSLIPYYWMPSWSNTNDPSARTLEIYKNE